MYSNRPRRRYRSNDRPFRRRNNSEGQRNGNPNMFVNGQVRDSSFRVPSSRGGQNIHKLIEKFTSLAREALSSGDKILSENYFQHADHYSRIISDNNVKNSKNDSFNSSQAAAPQDETSEPSKSDAGLDKNQDK